MRGQRLHSTARKSAICAARQQAPAARVGTAAENVAFRTVAFLWLRTRLQNCQDLLTAGYLGLLLQLSAEWEAVNESSGCTKTASRWFSGRILDCVNPHISHSDYPDVFTSNRFIYWLVQFTSGIIINLIYDFYVSRVSFVRWPVETRQCSQ